MESRGELEEEKTLSKHAFSFSTNLGFREAILIMAISNAGFRSVRNQEIEEMRRFYHCPLPPKNSLAWFYETCQVLFWYDAFKEAEDTLRRRESCDTMLVL